MSFLVTCKHPRWDGHTVWCYAECETREQVKELRRLLKRRSKKFTVRVTGDVEDAAAIIRQLEHDEVRLHPEVLYAIINEREYVDRPDEGRAE